MRFLSTLNLLLVLFIVLSTVTVNGQNSSSDNTVKLYGYIKDTYTAVPLSEVAVLLTNTGKGVVTDERGYYEIVVPKGRYVVKFSRVDLKEETHMIDLIKDVEFNLEMKEKVFRLEEVTISSIRENANVENLDVGKNKVDIEKINKLPAFLGEVDVVKSLILLPGISTVGEGASGFNVRGGGVDQNLILQDGGLIFNSSHVFGFFSNFNPAMVKNVTIYKSGLPAKYGGRLSSVLDVELKEGDFNEYNVSGGIGLVSSKIAVDGPIIKNKLSFIAGGRASYSDWLLGLAKDPDIQNSSAIFQDFNGKLAYRMNESNKITYSGYFSNDKFALASDTTFQWQTTNHVLQWTHIFNDKLVAYTDVAVGRYWYNIEDIEGLDSFSVESNIDYGNVKLDFVYDLNQKNKINFGMESILYSFQPGSQKPLGDKSGVKRIEVEHEKSLETSFYAEDEYKISDRLSIRGGLRYSLFYNVGPGTDYIYGEGGPREIDNITDTVKYSSGDIIADYNGLEPRVNVNLKLTDNSSIKASFNRTRQYLHLITNTAAVTPTDVWKTSNKYIKPEIGDQYSLGYFRNFKNNTIETSVEAYYKEAENIVDFKNGTTLLMNENIEAALINGTSTAYGVEFFVNKKAGILTGWMSYTYSRIFRTINGEHESEKINDGERYPANNDKPHDFSFALNYKSSPVVQFGANFTYSTGRPATVPLGLYDVSRLTNVFNFSDRNDGRIPDYHRLDVSMTVDSKPKINRKWSMSWTFAIYNLYGRKNAYSVFYENQYGSPPKAYKLSVLGSAFPSIMINFKF